MIAGLATHAALNPPSERFGYLMTQESINAVSADPTPDQQAVINDYRALYRGAFGFEAHGLHYINGLSTAVFIPCTADSPFVDNS